MSLSMKKILQRLGRGLRRWGRGGEYHSYFEKRKRKVEGFSTTSITTRGSVAVWCRKERRPALSESTGEKKKEKGREKEEGELQ